MREREASGGGVASLGADPGIRFLREAGFLEQGELGAEGLRGVVYEEGAGRVRAGAHIVQRPRQAQRVNADHGQRLRPNGAIQRRAVVIQRLRLHVHQAHAQPRGLRGIGQHRAGVRGQHDLIATGTPALAGFQDQEKGRAAAGRQLQRRAARHRGQGFGELSRAVGCKVGRRAHRTHGRQAGSQVRPANRRGAGRQITPA